MLQLKLTTQEGTGASLRCNKASIGQEQEWGLPRDTPKHLRARPHWCPRERMCQGQKPEVGPGSPLRPEPKAQGDAQSIEAWARPARTTSASFLSLFSPSLCYKVIFPNDWLSPTITSLHLLEDSSCPVPTPEATSSSSKRVRGCW